MIKTKELKKDGYLKGNAKYEQMSIYDFIEESQELPPSETVAQVDEAQDDWKLNAINQPSSALDAKESTEDTDMTLFSVGDVLTVRQASEVYLSNESPEDFYFLKEYEGEQVKIIDIDDNVLKCNTFNLDKDIYLRKNEVIKIN